MTLEERIEAAAASLGAEFIDHPTPDWNGRARRALHAAFPELFSSPPTHWIAPLPDIDADEEWEVVDGPAW